MYPPFKKKKLNLDPNSFVYYLCSKKERDYDKFKSNPISF